MISASLRVRVRRERLGDMLTELAYFQESGREDAGNLAFHWSQQRDDPQCFVLFEQWESQRALDAHLRPELVERWNAMQPWFEGAPVATALRPLDDLLRPPDDGEAQSLVKQWFELLNDHGPVEQLLPLISEQGLRIRLPERTIDDAQQFVDWYEGIERTFRDQSHTIVSLTTQPAPEGRHAQIIVIWKATRVADGTRIAARAEQSWTLARSPLTAGLMIRTYDVDRFEDVTP